MQMLLARSRTHGFTLIEVAVVLIILTLLATGGLGLVNGLRTKQQYTGTRTNLEKVDAALANFVSVTGRLPCPADGSLPLTNPLSGVETARNAMTGCTTDQRTGVVPWRTLGISEDDATDGWYRRMGYRVPNNLTIDGAMNLTACDSVGPAGLNASGMCVAGCSTVAATCTPVATYLNGKGFPIQDIAGNLLQNPAVAPFTGAAYVVVSHGATSGGSYGDSGAFAAAVIDDTQETINNNNSPLGAYYVRDNIVEGVGAGHFDDLVSTPTIMVVTGRAQTGARAHP